MSTRDFGGFDLAQLRSGNAAEVLRGGGQEDLSKVFLLPNSIPISRSASLLGRPVGPSHWDELGSTARDQMLRELLEEIDVYRVIAPPRDMTPRSDDIWKQLKTGRAPTTADLSFFGAELVARRPVLPVRSDGIDHPDPDHDEFSALWPAFVTAAASVVDSVGLIGNVFSQGDRDVITPLGTAWMVAPTIAATNTHVVKALRKHGWVQESTEPGAQAAVHFGVRRDSEGPVGQCVRVVAADTAADIALITLEAENVSLPTPVDVVAFDDGLADRKVVVLGYPLPDENRNPLLGDVVLALSGGYEAASPGVITAVDGPLLRHNCSTTGGNSGSPVLDMLTGTVVGVHREGTYFLGENIASQADELRKLLETVT